MLSPSYQRLFDALASRPATVRQLAQATSHSAGFVDRVLRELQDEGLVRVVDKQPTGPSGGRRENIWGIVNG
jgi:DNA-binding IscR family transcriptional regulator